MAVSDAAIRKEVRLKTLRFAALAGSIVALGVTTYAPQGAWRATYVAAYQPTFGTQGVPYSGIMKLSFNHGIVSGTYVAESVRPDPLYGRTIAVSGNVGGDQVTLNLSAAGGFTVRGTLHHNGELSGTATIRGRFDNFLAKVKSSP